MSNACNGPSVPTCPRPVCSPRERPLRISQGKEKASREEGRGYGWEYFLSWMNVAILSDPCPAASEVSQAHRLESWSSCRFSILCRQMCLNHSLIFLRPRLWLLTLSMTLANPWASLVLNFLSWKMQRNPQTLNLAFLSQTDIMRLKWENTEVAFKQIVGWEGVMLRGKSSQTMSSWKVKLGKFKFSVLSMILCHSRNTRAGIAQAAWELLRAVTLKVEWSVH